MLMQNHKTRLRWFLLVCILLAGMGAISLSEYVYADLPPRPTKTPIPVKEQPTPDRPAGTLILNTQPPVTGLWSVVQWQGATGNWRDVEGWRGETNVGKTIWWVEQAQWHTGPFRWAVFETRDGKLLATSEHFFLPGSGETSIIRVDLENFVANK